MRTKVGIITDTVLDTGTLFSRVSSHVSCVTCHLSNCHIFFRYKLSHVRRSLFPEYTGLHVSRGSPGHVLGAHVLWNTMYNKDDYVGHVSGGHVLQYTLDNQLFTKVPRQVVVGASLQQDYLKHSQQ